MELNNIEVLKHLLAMGAALNDPTPLPGSGSEPFTIVPTGFEIKSLAHLMPPTRIKHAVALIDADSFCDYVNRFKNPDTLIFASVSEHSARLTAVLDYHGAPGRLAVDELQAGVSTATVATPEVPKYGSHRATLDLVQTPDWKAWLAADRKPKSQGDFAMWLEEFAHLFNHKDCVLKGAELLELITTLFAKQDVSYESLIRLQTSGFSCNYQETPTAGGNIGGGKVELPPIIQAAMQPFEGSDPYLVSARLKVKIADRKLQLWFETVQLQKIVRDAVLDAVKKVSAKTGIVPLIGSVQ